ncbi:MAG: acetate--CoA ligase family protein [Nitrospinae bacterium]|nr:acetate--CoA ligase family protein [Nitrospinota bacterium]
MTAPASDGMVAEVGRAVREKAREPFVCVDEDSRVERMTPPMTGTAAAGRRVLTEVAAKELVAAQGIPVVPTHLAKSRAEAIRLAKELGFPVALKVASPDILHKSDVGGVRLHIGSIKQVGEAYREVLARARAHVPEATIDGVAVQGMAKPGIEVMVGVTQDPTFGPVVMFGLGGIFVELLRDVAFRVIPLRPRDARAMLREIEGFPTLQGYRGMPPVDLHALEDIILKLSALAEQRPDICEIDLNPVYAYPTGVLAVDARIILT